MSTSGPVGNPQAVASLVELRCRRSPAGERRTREPRTTFRAEGAGKASLKPSRARALVRARGSVAVLWPAAAGRRADRGPDGWRTAENALTSPVRLRRRPRPSGPGRVVFGGSPVRPLIPSRKRPPRASPCRRASTRPRRTRRKRTWTGRRRGGRSGEGGGAGRVRGQRNRLREAVWCGSSEA